VDNGFPGGSAGDLPTDLALWLIGLGVDMIWNPPHQPQYNGVIERFQGVGKQWCEPATCRTTAELQQRLDHMDYLQRERYPVEGGQSRMQLFPTLAHSDRRYTKAWERRHWSLDRVCEHLTGYTVVRRVDAKGAVSLYNRNRYVAEALAGQWVFVRLDPQTVEWVVLDHHNHQLRTRPATEISRDNILNMTVTHRRRALNAAEPQSQLTAKPPVRNNGTT
jgi:hypothetical protein